VPERKLISIVTPCYNEELNIDACCRAVRDLFEKDLARYDYEHIFCDNCSTDSTVEKLRALAAADKRVKVILNARNFGPLRSNYNGVMATRGDAVLLFLPADLQDPPELIPQFMQKWEEGFQVVRGVRKKREESFLMSTIRKIYYRVVARLANVDLPKDVGEFQLVDKVVIQALRQFEDYHPYLRGMVASCGFKTAGIDFVWKKRERGKSKAHWYGLIDIGLNGIISFTNVPLRICLFFGFLLAAASILFAFVSLFIAVFQRLVYGVQLAPAVMPTLIVAIFFFSGVQLFFLGLLGEYIAAIHSQVRKRPLVIEKERINF